MNKLKGAAARADLIKCGSLSIEAPVFCYFGFDENGNCLRAAGKQKENPQAGVGAPRESCPENEIYGTGGAHGLCHIRN